MQMSLTLLIAVIVILITGLVVLVIFGQGISNVQGTLGITKDACDNACLAYKQICATSKPHNQLPGCTDQARTDECTCPSRTA